MFLKLYRQKSMLKKTLNRILVEIQVLKLLYFLIWQTLQIIGSGMTPNLFGTKAWERVNTIAIQCVRQFAVPWCAVKHLIVFFIDKYKVKPLKTF